MSRENCGSYPSWELQHLCRRSWRSSRGRKPCRKDGRCTRGQGEGITSRVILSTDNDEGPYREKTVANMYAFEGEYTFKERFFYVQCQR
jgi:hypothetical protein